MNNADTSDINLLDDTIIDTSDTENNDQPELSEEEKQAGRIKYWQSQSDKYRKQAEDNALGAPYARLIQEKPELALVIQAELAKPRGDAIPSGPKKPEPPARPADFDEVASYNNPESESFKYRKAHEVYREQQFNYLENLQTEKSKIFEAELNKRKAEEDGRLQVAQLKTILMQKGLTAPEAEDFVQFTGDPKNTTVDNLIVLYKLKRGATSQKNDDKAEELRRQQSQNRAPLPPFGGGPGPVKVDEPSVSFSKSLIAKAKRSK